MRQGFGSVRPWFKSQPMLYGVRLGVQVLHNTGEVGSGGLGGPGGQTVYVLLVR